MPLSALKEYRRKRDFAKTAEPSGEGKSPRSVGAKKTAKPKATPKPRAKGKSKAADGGGGGDGDGRGKNALRFVIQKHDASRLHYDFRLELDGTLKSWAVPKGVPFKKGERRLAVHVEDHPVEYIDFEGTIPKGQYGGGTVMLWDEGTYEPTQPEPSKTLAGGKLHFVLHGKKLRGEWYLVQLRGSEEWLLIRGGEDMKPVSQKQDDTSVRSGKSMAALSRSSRVWTGSGAGAVAKKAGSVETDHSRALVAPPRKKAGGTGRSWEPKFVEPMQALLVEKAPPGEWAYEIKFDGFRALAFKHGKSVQLLSRNKKDFAERFPEIVEAVAALGVEDAIIDGEIVALDAKGRSSFQLLQGLDTGERPPLVYYVFDLLELKGKSLLGGTLAERKTQLEGILKKCPPGIRYSASLEGDVDKLLKQAKSLGLEGLIGKRADSVYEAGRRSGAWIKLKLLQEQEFVIGGYTPPGGSRKHIGALIVGVFEDKKLVCTGKVGTGFNAELLRSLHARFEEIAVEECPFANLPEARTRRYGQAITASVMKTCHWVKPVLVGQLRFTEWTNDGRLRHPVFLGLREDKNATDVVREKAR